MWRFWRRWAVKRAARKQLLELESSEDIVFLNLGPPLPAPGQEHGEHTVTSTYRLTDRLVEEFSASQRMVREAARRVSDAVGVSPTPRRR